MGLLLWVAAMAMVAVTRAGASTSTSGSAGDGASLVRVGGTSSGGSAQQVTSLDGAWRLTSDAGHSLTGSVPGDLISDLEQGRIVQDPLYELGFISNNTKRSPPWAAHVWTYSTNFTAPPGSLLVFEGIKMCAKIVINGEQALFATDQFLRYQLPVSGAIELEVVFDPNKDTGGR